MRIYTNLYFRHYMHCYYSRLNIQLNSRVIFVRNGMTHRLRKFSLVMFRSVITDYVCIPLVAVLRFRKRSYLDCFVSAIDLALICGKLKTFICVKTAITIILFDFVAIRENCHARDLTSVLFKRSSRYYLQQK